MKKMKIVMSLFMAIMLTLSVVMPMAVLAEADVLNIAEQNPYATWEWDKDKPRYVATYTDAEKAAQLESGTKHRQNILDAVKEGKSSYTIPAGVYRWAGGIDFTSGTDSTILPA